VENGARDGFADACLLQDFSKVDRFNSWCKSVNCGEEKSPGALNRWTRIDRVEYGARDGFDDEGLL